MILRTSHFHSNIMHLINSEFKQSLIYSGTQPPLSCSRLWLLTLAGQTSPTWRGHTTQTWTSGQRYSALHSSINYLLLFYIISQSLYINVHKTFMSIIMAPTLHSGPSPPRRRPRLRLLLRRWHLRLRIRRRRRRGNKWFGRIRWYRGGIWRECMVRI